MKTHGYEQDHRRAEHHPAVVKVDQGRLLGSSLATTKPSNLNVKVGDNFIRFGVVEGGRRPKMEDRLFLRRPSVYFHRDQYDIGPLLVSADIQGNGKIDLCLRGRVGSQGYAQHSLCSSLVSPHGFGE